MEEKRMTERIVTEKNVTERNITKGVIEVEETTESKGMENRKGMIQKEMVVQEAEEKGKGGDRGRRKKKRKAYLHLPALLIGYLVLLWVLIFLETGGMDLKTMGRMFLHFEVLFLTILTVAVILAVSGTGRRYLRGWKIALGIEKEKGYSLPELARNLEAIRFVRMTIFAVSGIIAMIGLVDMLYHMDSLNSLGPATANVFLSFFYACALMLFQLPIEGRLRELQMGYMDEGEDEEPVEDEQTLYFRLRGMGLTDREAEVARLVAADMSNKDIGKELCISNETVKKHITHILEKTGCKGRDGLAEMVRSRQR